jgi:putative MATE family efflux protein
MDEQRNTIMMHNSAKAEKMGLQSIGWLLFKFSVPAIIAMVIGAIFTITDTIFIGRLGTDALAAVTITFPFIFAITVIANGTAIGVASLISRRLGSKDYDGANRAAAQTITLAVIIGGLITAIGLLLLNPFLLANVGSNTEWLRLATSYGSIALMAGFTTVFMISISSVIRAEGSPLIASGGIIVAALINLVLDPVFIYVLDMGVQGAAIASAISSSAVCILYIGYLMSKKTLYQFRRHYFIPNFMLILRIFYIGLPLILGSVIFSIALILLNRYYLSYGANYLNVFGVVSRLSSLAIIPVVGIASAIIPLIGYNFGADNNNRTSEIISKTMLVSLVWGLLCAVLALTIPKQVLSIFNIDTEFIRIGTTALVFWGIYCLVDGPQRIMRAFFQGTGNGIPLFVVSIGGELLLLPLAIVLMKIIDANGLFLAIPACAIIITAILVIWMRFDYKKLKLKFRLRFSGFEGINVKYCTVCGSAAHYTTDKCRSCGQVFGQGSSPSMLNSKEITEVPNSPLTVMRVAVGFLCGFFLFIWLLMPFILEYTMQMQRVIVHFVHPLFLLALLGLIWSLPIKERANKKIINSLIVLVWGIGLTYTLVFM